MSEPQDIKVFISWSGSLADAVATALRGWLPKLLDRVDPFMSQIDIAAGSRRLESIAQELVDTRFGIIVVTGENQDSAWLNFEAGAMSKSLDDNKILVAPLLVDFNSPNEITGPLKQFQGSLLNKDGITKILHALSDVCGVARVVIDDRIDLYWPRFEPLIEEAKAKQGTTYTKRDPVSIADETLTLVREISRAMDYVTAVGLPVDRRPGQERFEELSKAAFRQLCEENGVEVFRLRMDHTTPMHDRFAYYVYHSNEIQESQRADILRLAKANCAADTVKFFRAVVVEPSVPIDS